jgi:hypothetical protein
MAVAGRVRVSCAGLCRIVDDEGRYLLALNYNRLGKGVRVFMPLGGALMFDDPDLLKRFDAVPENRRERELRLYLPSRRLDDFRAWFLRGVGREIDPFRELYEELVQETGFLDALARPDLRFQRRWLREEERVTDRSGVEGEPTHYWLEIFDTELVSEALSARLHKLDADAPLRWLTREEIESGTAEDGAHVEAKVILAPG